MMEIENSINEFTSGIILPDMGDDNVLYLSIKNKFENLVFYTSSNDLPIVLHSYISSVKCVGVEPLIRSYMDMIIRLNKNKGNKLKRTDMVDYCENMASGRDVKLSIGNMSKKEVTIVAVIYVNLTGKDFTFDKINKIFTGI